MLISPDSDILHPGRANISKEDLREKLAGMYKAGKEQVNVFGLRTQFGGGKTTGFALVYDSPEAMKKFEPNYRLVRVGLATKVERASRQQREWLLLCTSLATDDTPSNMVAYCLELSTETPALRYTNFWSSPTQASSARTARRPCAVLPRSRVPRPRRRNKRIALDFPFPPSLPVSPGVTAGQWLRLRALRYDNAPLHSTKFDTTRYLELMTQGRDGWVSSGSCDINSIQYRLSALRSPIQEFFSARDEALGCIFESPYGGIAASWIFRPYICHPLCEVPGVSSFPWCSCITHTTNSLNPAHSTFVPFLHQPRTMCHSCLTLINSPFPPSVHLHRITIRSCLTLTTEYTGI